MIEEVKKGNRTTTTFSRTGWANIIQGLKDKFPHKKYNKDQLKNKYNQLRQKQKNCKAIISETRMGYSAETGKLTALEDVWERLSAVHHRYYKKFKKRGCPEYPKLCFIFGDTSASGQFAQPSSMYISNDSNEKRTNGKEDDVVSLESSGNTNGTGDNTKDKANDKTKEKTPKSKKAKTTFATSIERSMAFMAEQSKRKTDIFEQHVAALATLIAAKIEAASKKMDTTSLTECMEIMQGMDIDGI
ncbi:hypothetical protein LINGRAHAP2_LOCUS24763 [Linum grandiflorum]